MLEFLLFIPFFFFVSFQCHQERYKIYLTHYFVFSFCWQQLLFFSLPFFFFYHFIYIFFDMLTRHLSTLDILYFLSILSFFVFSLFLFRFTLLALFWSTRMRSCINNIVHILNIWERICGYVVCWILNHRAWRPMVTTNPLCELWANRVGPDGGYDWLYGLSGSRWPSRHNVHITLMSASQYRWS